RRRARDEVDEVLVPELAHPVRLFLVRRDRIDELVRETTPGLEEIVLRLVRVREAVLVLAADPLDDIGLCHRHHDSPPTLSGEWHGPACRPPALVFILFVY